ncbi:hypothetical protein GC174_15720 [bacterium]|nr:hypothetical protein [bacterium]
MRFDSNFSEIRGAGGSGETNLPTFDNFLWPVLEVMKTRVGEWSRAQVVEGVLEHPAIKNHIVGLSESDQYYVLSICR